MGARAPRTRSVRRARRGVAPYARTTPLLLMMMMLLTLATRSNAFAVTSIDEFTDEIAMRDEPAMVLFGTPSCTHCRAAKPHWASFEREFWLEKRLVRVADVDCVASKDVCAWHGVTSYPTIKYFDGENGEFGGEYKRAVTYDALAAFAEHYLVDDEDEDDV